MQRSAVIGETSELAIGVMGRRTVFILSEGSDNHIRDALERAGADVRIVWTSQLNERFGKCDRGGIFCKTNDAKEAFRQALKYYRMEGWKMAHLRVSSTTIKFSQQEGDGINGTGT